MKQKKWILLFSILLGVFFSFTSHQNSWALPSDIPMPETSSKKFKEAVKRARKMAKRKVASQPKEDVPEEKATSELFRNIRNSFIGGEVQLQGKEGDKVVERPGAKSAEDIHELLTQIQKNLKSGVYKDDQKALFLANQLSLAIPFRGFVFRARDIFDTRDGDAKAAHAFAVTMLRTIASGIITYLPTDQWPAMFQYSVEPFYVPKTSGWRDKPSQEDRKSCLEKWRSDCDIYDGATFQAWLVKEVMPVVSDARTRMYSMDFEKEPVYWDNQILYGAANFTSSRDRFLKLGEAERYAMLSAYDVTLSSILGINAFRLDGFFEAFDSVAKEYGYSAAFNTFNATSMKRFNVVRKKHKNLFKFKGDTAKQRTESLVYLKSSYAYLKVAMQNAYVSWQILDNGEHDNGLQQNLFDPRAVAPFSRIIGTGMQNSFAILGTNMDLETVSNPEVVSAVVNGEKVSINLAKFFEEPPNSLQDFMPLRGEGRVAGARGPGALPQKKADRKGFLYVNIDGKKVEYRDYFRGSPTHWNYSVYDKYFPGTKTSDGVRQLNRVLSQSWGTFFLGIPLSFVVL